MARNPRNDNSKTSFEDRKEANTVPVEEHPDFKAGQVGEAADAGPDDHDTLTPQPGGPLPGPFPGPLPGPFPGPRPIPVPAPFPPIFNICSAVSGRYIYTPRPVQLPGPAVPIGFPSRPIPVGPILPFNLLKITVRVDVDRFLPQNRISIELSRRFPNQRAHAIAEVTSDRCTGLNTRVITADIVYRDGDVSAIPGTTVTFRARRTTSLHYGAYSLEISGGGSTTRTYKLSFQSDKFDNADFEVDRVSNAGSIVTAYNTGDHPTRPANLPIETLGLETVFERSGFDVRMSPNTTVIPNADAGSNGTWSDAEMHNAMVTYWSRFANRPQWALWVLYAARHDRGRGLGGIMFDDIGPNHRQGTAIFTDSFIKDVPAGDPDPQAFRDRNEFWTAVHEMGHAFNLAHSWQKALSIPGTPQAPWIPLANEPEARSFMNYPRSVSGGENAFFSDFRFRFSDDELVFMRHAPRRFVQMGNSDWFVNHAFEAPDALAESGTWTLEIRPNRDSNAYRFLEPVMMELKLTNTSSKAIYHEPDMLRDGRHITVFIQREGGPTRQWSPMITTCHEPHEEKIDPGESIYGAHMIGAATGGFLIDEPGFYKVQAAIDMTDEILVSNVLRLYVAPPMGAEEAAVAPDYFTEDVARVLAFRGAPALSNAEDTLREVVDRCGENPATAHAKVALSNPGLRSFKVLDADAGREGLKLRSMSAQISNATEMQVETLMSAPDAAADTIGNIAYFDQLRTLAETLESHNASEKAVDVMEKTIEIMRKRQILASVIDNAERRLKRRK